MFLLRRLILLVFLSTSVVLASAQNDFQFERIFINEGLSNNSINAVLQTQDGFLWVATKDGLNRYDGQRFKIFKKDYDDSTSLKENYVMSLAESREGVLWVGTWGGGLQRYDRFSESFISYRHPAFRDAFIQCIYEDQEGMIWFGTTEGGLYCLNPENGFVKNYAFQLTGADHFPSSNITSIVQDSTHRFWVGTWDAGLIAFNPGEKKIEQYRHDAEDSATIASDGVWDIRLESDNKLLLSTHSGPDMFDIMTGQVVPIRGLFPGLSGDMSTAVRQTYRDRRGRLWLGTYDYGGLLLIYTDERGESQNTWFINEDDNSSSLSIDRIRCIYEDIKGNIWIGTENGLNKLPIQKAFRKYKNLPLRPNSLGGRVVSSIIRGHNDNLWVAYGGGGFDRIELSNDQVRHYKHDPEVRNTLSNCDVVSIYESSDQCLWIATMYGGLDCFNPQTEEFRNYSFDPDRETSIRSDWVLQVLETHDSVLFVGTNSGLDVLDRSTGKFSRFEPVITAGAESIPPNISVNVLFEDKAKRLWIGTWLDGVFCYDPGQQSLTQYLAEDRGEFSISSNKITCIYEDSAGIWFGTHSGGLNRFDEPTGKFYHFNTGNGLPNDVVFGIQGGSGSDLWISTMKGLAKMDVISGMIRVYDELDGIVNNQFNWRASYKDDEGRLYFGGINGFVSFHPDSILVDTIPPAVAITSFTIFNKEDSEYESLPSGMEKVLKHDQNFFSIDFTALDMMPHQKHKYAYMLEGIDQDWVYSENRNTAFYTDIHHGSFQFLARVCNADNVWSEPVSLSITILPAWWNTIWIKLAGILAIFSIGILLTRIRLWHLLEIERIRLNISSDLHDEMGSNLSSISVDSQQLMNQNKGDSRTYELATDIYKTTNETIDSIRDIIWFINPKNDDGENMLYKMREKAATMLAGMKWSFEVSDEIKLDAIRLEVRRNLFLIYKETLNNVIRHSKAESCEIKLKKNSFCLELSICDDGKGFNPNKDPYGGGLSNLHYRAKKIGAEIEISSMEGKGTCMELVLPLKTKIFRKEE